MRVKSAPSDGCGVAGHHGHACMDTLCMYIATVVQELPGQAADQFQTG